jgi:hypothetical protein
VSEEIATVTVSVDFPGAEGIWVTRYPVYEGESITETIKKCGDSCIDNLARSAGELYATRVRYGKGLIR